MTPAIHELRPNTPHNLQAGSGQQTEPQGHKRQSSCIQPDGGTKIRQRTRMIITKQSPSTATHSKSTISRKNATSKTLEAAPRISDCKKGAGAGWGHPMNTRPQNVWRKERIEASVGETRLTGFPARQRRQIQKEAIQERRA